jgi:hypothetical protein
MAMGLLTFTPSVPSAQDLAHHAFVHRLEFHRGLVGLDLGEDVAGGDGVALLHQPFGERAFLHRGGERGHENFGCHYLRPLNTFR